MCRAVPGEVRAIIQLISIIGPYLALIKSPQMPSLKPQHLCQASQTLTDFHRRDDIWDLSGVRSGSQTPPTHTCRKQSACSALCWHLRRRRSREPKYLSQLQKMTSSQRLTAFLDEAVLVKCEDLHNDWTPRTFARWMGVTHLLR